MPEITKRQPASPLERQFWLNEQIAPATAANWVLAPVRADGPVDLAALDAALAAVAHRHEALRTAFVLEGGQVVREVLAESLSGPTLNLEPGTDFEQAAAVLLGPDTFDIATGRVHRTAVSVDAHGATIYLAVHHIAFDGYSQELFVTDLARAYGLAVIGASARLPVRHRQPAEQLDPLRSAELVEHWRALLAGTADLPGAGAEPSQRELSEAELVERRAECAAADWQSARQLARHLACSPFAVLLTAYGGALAELSGAADFCVGTPVVARATGQEDELGCLINTVPVRVTDPRAAGAVERVWGSVIESVFGADLPCDEIIRAVRTKPGRRMPVYQALFTFDGFPVAGHAAGPVEMRVLLASVLGGQAEIQLQSRELPDGTLQIIVQAPANSSWADRLGDLLGSFGRHLKELS